MTPLVTLPAVRPTWLPDGRFWYRNTTPAGAEFVLVDPVRRTRAARGSTSGGSPPASPRRAASPPTRRGFRSPPSALAPDGKSDHRATWARGGGAATCARTAAPTRLERPDAGTPGAPPAAAGPEGSAARPRVRARPRRPTASWPRSSATGNLWVRDVATGQETQLTTDGVKDFGYATDNAGWTHSDRPILIWSPDSRRIATFQHDERGVGEMYLVQHAVGHPALESWKYPLPGDSVISCIHRVVIIDVDGPTPARRAPPDAARPPSLDGLRPHRLRRRRGPTSSGSPDGSPPRVRLERRATTSARTLRVADAATGAVRDVFDARR